MTVVMLLGRSPHGERGLKFEEALLGVVAPVSLPTRGAWIEILTIMDGFHFDDVAPHTGSDKFVHRYVP